MSRPARALTALCVLVLAASGTVLAVRAANGDYAGDYPLTGYFPRAGQGLEPGSQVDYRGVQVGRVASVTLAGRRAKVTMLLSPAFRVPAGTSATIQPVNLFGAEQVTLREPASGGGPALRPGATLARTATGDELGTLFTAAAPLLRRVTTTSLATVIGELSAASSGEGPRIKASITAGAALAAFFDQTLPAQLAALDSFAGFTAALAPDGAALNGLSHQENLALPAFTQDASAYDRLVGALTSLSRQLAALLADYHPTFVTLLADGADPARVLTAQATQVGQVVAGMYRYAYKVGTAVSTETLPGGSHFVYFQTFVLFSDVNTLVCDLLAPKQAGLTFLEPLQQALTGAGTPFTCAAQFAAFDALQTTAAPPPAGAPVQPPAPTVTSVAGATRSLGNAVYGILGQPAAPSATTLGGFVQSLLG